MSEGMSYIGRKPCGCIVFAIVDNPEHKKAVATEVAKCMREGLTIERVTGEFVRQQKFGCIHEEPKKHKKAKETRQKPLL